jgi:hypothetical protein
LARLAIDRGVTCVAHGSDILFSHQQEEGKPGALEDGGGREQGASVTEIGKVENWKGSKDCVF